MDGVGDDVGVFAATDLADGENDGVLGVGRAGDELVERADELGGGGDRVFGFVGTGGVAPLALDGELEQVAVGGHGSGAEADFAGAARRVDMQGKDFADVGECARFDHLGCARSGFFGRLKQGTPGDGPGELVLGGERREGEDRAIEDGGVGVVAASVEDAVVGAAVGNLFFVLNAEGVDVAPEGDAIGWLRGGVFSENAAAFVAHADVEVELA